MKPATEKVANLCQHLIKDGICSLITLEVFLRAPERFTVVDIEELCKTSNSSARNAVKRLEVSRFFRRHDDIETGPGSPTKSYALTDAARSIRNSINAEIGALLVLAAIRESAGDAEGRLMQDELIARIAKDRQDALRFRALKQPTRKTNTQEPCQTSTK